MAVCFAFALLATPLAGCKRRGVADDSDIWVGVDHRKVSCDYPSNMGTRVFCVAGGVAYFCVGEDRIMGGSERRWWECAPVRSLSDLEKP